MRSHRTFLCLTEAGYAIYPPVDEELETIEYCDGNDQLGLCASVDLCLIAIGIRDRPLDVGVVTAD